MILVTSNFAVLILDTSIVDTVSNLLKTWEQSFDLGDGNHITLVSGWTFFDIAFSVGQAGMQIDPLILL